MLHDAPHLGSVEKLWLRAFKLLINMVLCCLATFLLLMPVMLTPALAGRCLEPLTHPWAVISGGLLSAGVVDDQQVRLFARVAWRIIQLLICL